MRPTWAHGLKKGVNLLSKFCSPGEQWGLGLGATYTLPKLIQIPWASFPLSAASATSALLIFHLPHGSPGNIAVKSSLGIRQGAAGRTSSPLIGHLTSNSP